MQYSTVCPAPTVHHVQTVFEVPPSHCEAWTDSTVVLHWLRWNSQARPYLHVHIQYLHVCNRVFNILELFGPESWHHVKGMVNPADYASQGLLPSELINHERWWEGPVSLKHPSSEWPDQSLILQLSSFHAKEKVICVIVQNNIPKIQK